MNTKPHPWSQLPDFIGGTWPPWLVVRVSSLGYLTGCSLPVVCCGCRWEGPLLLAHSRVREWPHHWDPHPLLLRRGPHLCCCGTTFPILQHTLCCGRLRQQACRLHLRLHPVPARHPLCHFIRHFAALDGPRAASLAGCVDQGQAQAVALSRALCLPASASGHRGQCAASVPRGEPLPVGGICGNLSPPCCCLQG